jgi:hypothetical protein
MEGLGRVEHSTNAGRARVVGGSVPLEVFGGLTTVPLADSGGLTTVPLADSGDLTTVPLADSGGLTTVPMRVLVR